ncbi:MAG TPA: type 1 glutamine amidotransferase family protein [Candidatus Saccharimonadales bacterium]|nr:type 1 glutamine amidotransferase family protein [Candidatus Saccharimonadales bacterium]
MNKTVYLYVLPAMADWEPGQAIAELQSGRFFTVTERFTVKTVALTKEPVVTMGGVKITPDCSLEEVAIDNAALLILPGSDDWLQPQHEAALKLAQQFLKADVHVAAICGAVEAMAKAGMLDDVKHTATSLDYLKMSFPTYHGEAHFKYELAYTDDHLITAGSTAPVEFTQHILAALKVMSPEALEHWYGFYGKHDEASLMQLFGVLQAARQ